MTSADPATLPGLTDMLAELREAPEIYRPSRFWEHYTELNLRQLDDAGFAEFKRTINRNYFQFVVRYVREPQFRAALRQWRSHLTAAPVLASLGGPLELPAGTPLAQPRAALAGKTYAIYIALLWEYARRRAPAGLIESLEEPALGHPLVTRYRGREISEDLCNSALEYCSISEELPGGRPSGSGVIELGSGYGRLAWLFLRAWPGVRYVLVDIPPALGIAQRYLTELFPSARIFAFRRFDDPEEVAAELADAQIAFLTPNQLELLPPQQAGLFINVSSLHEMRPDQIANYFALIERHCSGYFYTKQWVRSENPYDNVVVHREDYPVPAGWEALFDRLHPIQTLFFEALYRLPGAP